MRKNICDEKHHTNNFEQLASLLKLTNLIQFVSKIGDSEETSINNG
ncbi:24849_t:CDS:1, partial [Racocetra persica]